MLSHRLDATYSQLGASRSGHRQTWPAALVLVLDEAVRDGIIVRNPAKDRARRRTVGRTLAGDERTSPRDLALPDVASLERLVAA